MSNEDSADRRSGRVATCELSFQGSGFRVQGRGAGFRVQGSVFSVQGSGFRVQGSGFMVQGTGCKVQGSGFRIQGSGCRVPGSGYRVQDSGGGHLEPFEVDQAHRPPGFGWPFFKLPAFLKLINTDSFAVWFVVTGDATPDGIRVVRSAVGAISSLPIVAYDWRTGSWMSPPQGKRAPRVGTISIEILARE